MERTLSDDLRQAAAEADVVLSPAYFYLPGLFVEGEELDAWLESVGTRWVGVVAIAELLNSDWATYPQELLELLGRKVEEELRQETTVILSNNQGTSLIYDYQVVRADAGNALVRLSGQCPLSPGSGTPHDRGNHRHVQCFHREGVAHGNSSGLQPSGPGRGHRANPGKRSLRQRPREVFWTSASVSTPRRLR